MQCSLHPAPIKSVVVVYMYMSTCQISVSVIKQVCLQLCHVVQQPAHPTLPALRLLHYPCTATC